MKRRAFLQQLAATPALYPGRVALASAPAPTADGATFSADQWQTMALVQDHLLPSEPADPSAPGAREVHATAYLDRALAVPDFDPETRRFILDGIGWLDALAVTRHQAPFHALAAAPREDLLHQIAESGAGERWLSALIGYTLEALLADPLYGGNPGGIGWTWLDHDPGQPRPTPENSYGRLGRS